MAFANLARRELHCKIVYYGPGRGGKTTNLVWLHGRLPPAQRSEAERPALGEEFGEEALGRVDRLFGSTA